jgi:hypothetical protein
MKNNKVLFITYENPFTRNSGDSIYTANIIDAIFDLKTEVDIIYFDTNAEEPTITEKLAVKFNVVNVVKFKKKSPLSFIFSSKPGMIVNRESKLYLKDLNNLLVKSNYQNIFINHQKMLFTLSLLLKRVNDSKIIFCSHNAEYLLSRNNAINSKSLVEKMIYFMDTYKTKKYEEKWLNKLDYITTISEHDENYFNEKFFPKTTVLRPVFNFSKSLDYKSKRSTELIIAGSFSWGPKRENLISFLKAKNFYKLYEKGYTLTVVGRAEKDLVDYVNNNFKGVKMTGQVDEIPPYYKNAFIAIIPEKLGGGFKLKVAEAALNKSVIFSIKGAITACNLVKGKHFLEFDSYENLIDGIINSKLKPNYIFNIMENAYNLATEDFSHKNLVVSLRKIIRKV